jgi:hypothetical protein
MHLLAGGPLLAVHLDGRHPKPLTALLLEGLARPACTYLVREPPPILRQCRLARRLAASCSGSACRSRQPAPATSSRDQVPNNSDVRARRRPRDADVHAPRAERRDPRQPAYRPTRRPRLRRRTHPTPRGRKNLKLAEPQQPHALVPPTRRLRRLHPKRRVVPDATGDLALPPRQTQRPNRTNPPRLHHRRPPAQP